nr:transposase [Nitrosomonas sp. GH22]
MQQQSKDSNKLYSLHEPQVYCVAKGKDHKQYEYGSKASIASAAQGSLIVDVASHEQNMHDNHTLPAILHHVEASRGKACQARQQCVIATIVASVKSTESIVLPGKTLKQDNCYQRDRKRKQCKRRATIEPIISHLKADYRMTKNDLKGAIGDHINLLMAACTWNLKQ